VIAKVTAFVAQYKKELAAQQAQTAALQAQTADVRDRIDERNSEMAAREEDQRRQRAQMMMNFLQANRVQLQMPQYTPPRQSVFTNCSTYGNQTSCTSQ
jgi:septal ring factor EnvC (AmiA/AmiB activator)